MGETEEERYEREVREQREYNAAWKRIRKYYRELRKRKHLDDESAQYIAYDTVVEEERQRDKERRERELDLLLGSHTRLRR